MTDARNFGWLPGAETPEEVMAKNEAMIRDADQAARNTAKLFFDVFDNPRGIELLTMLRDCTIEIPLVRVTGTFGGAEVNMTGAEWAYFREGQNSVVRMIEQQIKIALQPVDNEEMSDGRED